MKEYRNLIGSALLCILLGWLVGGAAFGQAQWPLPPGSDKVSVPPDAGKFLPGQSKGILGVPVFGQRDPAWSGIHLGGSQWTMYDSGCAVTSVAMVFRYYTGDDDPGGLCNWGNANGMLDGGGNINWARAADSQGGAVSWVASISWDTVAADIGYLRARIDQGWPVILKVHLGGSMHFVVLKGYSGDTLYINDPWYNDSVVFQDRYGDPARNIYGARVYSGSTVSHAHVSAGQWVRTQNTAGQLRIKDGPNGITVGHLNDGEVFYLHEGPVEGSNGLWYYRHDRGWTACCNMAGEVYLVTTDPPDSPLNPPTSVTAFPSSPRTSDDLSVSAGGGSDPDGEGIWYEYEWSCNGGAWGHPGAALLNSETSRGQQWRAHARTCDARAQSGWVDSNTITIDNTSPTAPTSVTITTPNPTGGQPLTASAGGSNDADGDSISYDYQWCKSSDGSTWGDWSLPGSTLPGAQVVAGGWKTRARANDGSATSAWVESPPVKIGGGVILATNPASGATNCPRRLSVVIAFCKPVVQGNAQLHFSLVPDGGAPVAGTFEWIKPFLKMRFTPNGPLARSTRYTAGFSKWVRFRDGSSCSTPDSRSFTTGSFPEIVAYGPSGTGVTRYPAWIWCRFDTRMRESVENVFTVSPAVSGSFGEWIDGRTCRFNPAAQLRPNTRYKVTVGRTARSTAGIAMSAPFSWEFTTGAIGAPALTVAAAATTSGADTAQITVNLSAAADVVVTIKNLAGRDVAILQPGELTAGMHSLLWNGRSTTGTKVPAGAYLLQVNARAADGSSCSVLTSLRR